MIQRNRSVAKGFDAADEEDQDRASRIAANLAKLDASAPAVRAPPLQWKGYAWRTFDTVRGALKGSQEEKKELLASGDAPAGPSSAPSGGSAVAALPAVIVQGFRQRQWCRVILPLALLAAIVAVLFVLSFSYAYGRFFARDPCEVAQSTKLWLAEHPRPRSKLDALFDPAKGLPKIVHQQWKTPDIPVGPYTLWHNKFLEQYPSPEWTHMIWTDSNARTLIAKDYPFFLPTYDSYEWGIQRADAVRYFVLHKYGGMCAFGHTSARGRAGLGWAWG
jgi:hypothetical protein